MKNYKILTESSDPKIQFQIPENILKSLMQRAEENGHSIDIEISIRLARSLERDLKMIAADNEIAYAAFMRIKQEGKKSSKRRSK